MKSMIGCVSELYEAEKERFEHARDFPLDGAAQKHI